MPSKYPEEPRFLAIGSIGTSCWTGIFTERGDAVRIISVRRSRVEEVRLYENNKS
ncbi:BrnT family toxin [Spirochaeta africana]|uniref:BrnT family toxin n=1 Tax=Spirochaeta africana TaxID=46355 RepID=UPI003CCAE8E0